MRILVTGGAGFIGSNYVRMILNGHLGGISEITVLDSITYAGNIQNLQPYLNDGDLCFIQGDICDSPLLSKILKNIDAVINFAAESHVDNSIRSSKQFMTSNIMGVHTILELAKENNFRYLQISTDEVYGSIHKGSWDENSPLAPNSPYSASKASADLLIRAFSKTYGIDSIITRCSNNFGPRQYHEKLIPLAIGRMLLNKKVPIYGSGDQVRDWLFVEDHCAGIHLALLNGSAGEIYNLGGGTELTNLELIELIASEFGFKDKNEYVEFVDDRKGHDFRYSLNYDFARKSLGYLPKSNFLKSLQETINWYKENVNFEK